MMVRTAGGVGWQFLLAEMLPFHPKGEGFSADSIIKAVVAEILSLEIIFSVELCWCAKRCVVVGVGGLYADCQWGEF